jgi:hypothetical protein
LNHLAEYRRALALSDYSLVTINATTSTHAFLFNDNVVAGHERPQKSTAISLIGVYRYIESETAHVIGKRAQTFCFLQYSRMIDDRLMTSHHYRGLISLTTTRPIESRDSESARPLPNLRLILDGSLQEIPTNRVDSALAHDLVERRRDRPI